jgi:ABC-type uncharacterized transport system permease subunit
MIDLALIASTLRLSTPLTFAAIGGLYCERGGIANIALEGFMLFGAFAAAATAYYTGNPWFGLLGGCAGGMAVAAIHAVVCIHFNGGQIISGAAINILAIGLPPVLCSALFGTASSSPVIFNTVPRGIPQFLQNLPLLGSFFSQISILDLFGLALVVLTIGVLKYTWFGLRLTSGGENPAALDAAGVSVVNYRTAGVLISGALAGLGGAYLSIAHGTQFIRNMTAGRGFIALAALIIGSWRPGYVLVGCLFFGLMDALQIRLQGNTVVPVELIQILPYVMTVIVLIGFFGKATQPASLGIPYHIAKKK